jgi:threonine synthase
MSLANGIGVNHPPRLKSLVEIARDTGGRVVAVSETKILSWQKELASLEGLIVEPTSAVVMGAAEKLIDQGFIKVDDVVLLPLTGFGIKEAIPGTNI